MPLEEPDRCKHPATPRPIKIHISFFQNLFPGSSLLIPVGLSALVAYVQVEARRGLPRHALPLFLKRCQLDIRGWERSLRMLAKQEGRERRCRGPWRTGESLYLLTRAPRFPRTGAC